MFKNLQKFIIKLANVIDFNAKYKSFFEIFFEDKNTDYVILFLKHWRKFEKYNKTIFDTKTMMYSLIALKNCIIKIFDR